MDKVILIHNGKKETFGSLHAQNILKLQLQNRIAEQHCWKLPDDSPWQFTGKELSLKPKKKTDGQPTNPRKDKSTR